MEAKLVREKSRVEISTGTEGCARSISTTVSWKIVNYRANLVCVVFRSFPHEEPLPESVFWSEYSPYWGEESPTH